MTLQQKTPGLSQARKNGGGEGRESPGAPAKVGAGSAGPQGRLTALQKGHLHPNTWQQQALGFTLIFRDPKKVQS